MIRLTTTMWFAIFMKQEAQRGAFVTAAKTGAQQAGAVFVVHNHLDGTASLLGPAPQAMFVESDTGRLFELILDTVPMQKIDEYMEKQLAFDPDLWIIETESGEGAPSLEMAV